MIHRIGRPEYLDWLVRWKEKQIIKVVLGVRRCGKSTLFEMYRDYLSANGVEDSQFIVLNFEDIEFEFIDNYKILYRYIAERLRPDKMNYIFLDEIQHVDEYEKAVDSLFLKENCDVYITGSNAYFLSGELATMLSGRYVELQMLPLSFREFSTGLKGTQREGLSNAEKFNQYINSSADTTFKTLMDTLPEEMRVYFSEPRELVVKYLDSISNFYTPWKGEVDHLKDLFIHGTLDNDPEKLSEFFKLWKEKFDETFGKVITSPSFGQNRNVVEQQNKAFDTFIDMFIIASEFSAKLNAVQSDAFKNIIKEYMEITKESTELKTFEEFFNFWSKKMDDRLVSYFSTEEFSKLLTQFGAAAMDFKMETNRLVEQQLSDTPIVTVGQLDSMIKNIYDLKKEIKALKKEVEALKKEATPAGEKKETK